MSRIDAGRYLPEMIEARRRIHEYPEEGWTEFATTAFIIAKLRSMDLNPLFGRDVLDVDSIMGRREEVVQKALKEVRARTDVDQGIIDELDGYTGAMVEIDTGRPGPCTALRFDIDCVTNSESDDPAHEPCRLGFASKRPGLMHSCGHDAHAAVGLGVAKWVVEHKDELKGRVKLVFQPAEEGVRGAAPMAAKGIVDDADYLVGSHVGCEFGLGEVGVLEHGFLATTKLDARFTGVRAHAGGDPEKGRSALVAAAAAVMALQGISRHSEGDTRIAIGTLRAGEGRNVVAADAFMELEVRGETSEVNQFMTEEACRMLKGAAAMYGVEVEITKAGEAEAYQCDPEVVEMLLDAAAEIPEVESARAFATNRGSEDCSMLAKRVREKGGKAGFFCWGCRHNGHHRSDFDVQDEASMPIGFKMMTGFLLRANKR